MRSSVSVILKDPMPDSILAYPDYNQTAEDHRCLLILIQSCGISIRPDMFGSVVDAVRSVPFYEIHGRKIYVRFVTGDYRSENNQWAEFQMHRAAVGLFSVGFAENAGELQELIRLHEVTVLKYQDTLIDSRLMVPNFLRSIHNNNPPSSLQSIEKKKIRPLLFYDSDYPVRSKTLLSDVKEFISSLFWVLESRRMDKQLLEKQDKLPFFCAPFEKRDFVGLDMESRVNKRRIYGRCQKYLGDLALLCGAPTDAFSYYETSEGILRNCHDWLWLANTMEGQCVVSTISWNDNTNGCDENEGMTFLSKPKVVEKYREIVEHYSKYKHAGIIETECSIKAVRVLKQVRNYLLAADFLQNIVFINLQMKDHEKIERFSALSNLYADIGFKRKAAFFHRVAAMRCVAAQNPLPQWSLCYHLLRKTVDGYQLSLQNKTKKGWPSLQIQILQELAGTARNMKNHRAAVSHMACLVEHYFDDLTAKEKLDFCHQLGLLNERFPNHHDDVNDDVNDNVNDDVNNDVNDDVNDDDNKDSLRLLPIVSIYKVPRVDSFVVNPLPNHRTPIPIVDSSGPFLFTPIQTGIKTCIQWVQSEICEVTIQLSNPLSADLKVLDLCLEYDGIRDFETVGTSLVLNSLSGPYTINLIGIPHQVGRLRITGYSCTIFGMKSVCSLIRDESFIEVLPSLPQMQLDIRGLKSELYHGEVLNLDVTFNNVGKKPIHDISLINFTVDVIKKTNTTTTTTTTIDALQDVKSPLMPGESVTRNLCLSILGIDVLVNGSPICQLHNDATVTSTSKVTVTFSFSYSNRDDEYRRMCLEKLNFDLLPSTRTGNWDVLQGDDPSECYLIVDVENVSEYEMELLYDHQRSLIIEPKYRCRVPLSVPKSLRDDNVNDLNGRELNRRFQVIWKLTEIEGRTGAVYLGDEIIDAKMIRSLSRSPFVVDVTNVVQCVVGEKTDIIIRLRNEDERRDLFLVKSEVVYNRDKFKGASALSEAFVLSRSRIITERLLKPKSAISCSFYVLPIISGNFEIQIRNEIKDENKCDTYIKTVSLCVKN